MFRRAAFIALPLALALAACGTAQHPLPTYEPGPTEPAGDALIGGLIEFDGSCVFISTQYSRTPVFFPEGHAVWNEAGTAIFFDGVRLERGKATTLAGTFIRTSHAALISPCGIDTTWLASRPGPTVH